MADVISNQDSQQQSAKLTAEGILDILNEDVIPDNQESNDQESNDQEDGQKDKKTSSKKELIKEEEEELEDQEDQEDQEEDQEEESEDKEVIDDIDSFHDVPSRAQVLKAFPDLYKKFPGLEKSIYREQQYSEIFPSIDAAKEAKDEIGKFKQLQSDVFSGDITKLFGAIKAGSKDAYGKISDNILETLHSVDEPSYNQLLERVIRTTLHNAFTTGRKNGNEQLEIAAELLNKWIFDDKEVKPYVKSNQRPEDDQVSELRKQQLAFARQQLDTAVADVSTRAQNIIKNTIEKNLDPKGLMSPYVKNKAMDDILSEVDKNFRSDKRFQELLDRHWKSAGNESFSETAKVRIRNILLSKAKSVLPEIMMKIKTEALRGSSAKVKKSDEPKKERKSIPDREDKSKASGPGKRISTLDFLNQD